MFLYPTRMLSFPPAASCVSVALHARQAIDRFEARQSVHMAIWRARRFRSPRFSGQTKQIFGRNTETETRLPGKAEISAETEILAETFFSAETASFGRNVLFRPEQYIVLHQIFGQNPGLNMFYFGLKRLYLISV